MKEQLELLIRLQAIDSQLELSKNKKSQHPIQLQKALAPLETARLDLDHARTELEALSASKRDKERDLQIKEDSIPKLKSRQTEIKTNKEFHALLLEIKAAETSKGQLEENLLILMEKLDEEKRKLTFLEKNVSEADFKLKATKKLLADEISLFDGAAAELEKNRVTIVQSVEKILLNKYEKLKSTKNILAVVPIIQGSCTGCHMALPPQLVAEVKMVIEILSCSNCHRILYWEASENPVGEKSLSSETERN